MSNIEDICKSCKHLDETNVGLMGCPQPCTKEDERLGMFVDTGDQWLALLEYEEEYGCSEYEERKL